MTAAPRLLGPAEPHPPDGLTGFHGTGKTSLLIRRVGGPRSPKPP
jgi:hypothetical protein